MAKPLRFQFQYRVVDGEGYVKVQQLWDLFDYLAVHNPAEASAFLDLRDKIKEKIIDPIERGKYHGKVH